MTFWATVTVKLRGKRRLRVHRYYITDVADEAQARVVLRRGYHRLYENTDSITFVRDHFEAVPPGPVVVSMGIVLGDP